MENLFKTIFPPVCMFCRRSGSMVCYSCLQECLVINKGVCIACGLLAIDGLTHSRCLEKGIPTQLFSCFSFKGKVKGGINRSKYPPYEFGALKELTRHGIKYALNTGYYLFDFVVISVPVSPEEYKRAGFSSAHLVAEEIARNLGLKLYDSSLEGIKDKKILLVEDICKTRATLLKVSKDLYTAGAKEIRCFTLSRVL